MSKGNLFQGQGSGKVGDVVFSVRRGEQIARVYTSSGGRGGSAASEAARAQRVRFGSASNQWSLYRYVCTRMFRTGKATNQSDYNYFVKRNFGLFPYLTKIENTDGVHCLMPGQFSEGNLGTIEARCSYPVTETASLIKVTDPAHLSSAVVPQNATMATFKAELRRAFPNARKVTILFSFASAQEVSDEGETFNTQDVTHAPAVIDLFEESFSGENAATIGAGLAALANSSLVSSLVESHSGNWMQPDQQTLFRLSVETANSATVAILDRCLVTFFATNDLANDCYTTIVPAPTSRPARGPLNVWWDYRTDDAFRQAADSYGFQGGVMRDTIATT